MFRYDRFQSRDANFCATSALFMSVVVLFNQKIASFDKKMFYFYYLEAYT